MFIISIVGSFYEHYLKVYLIENGIIIFPFIKKYFWNKKVKNIYEYSNGIVLNIVDKDKVFFTFNGKLITNLGNYKIHVIKNDFFSIVCETTKPRRVDIIPENDFSVGSLLDPEYMYVDDKLYIYFVYNSVGKVINKKSIILKYELI